MIPTPPVSPSARRAVLAGLLPWLMAAGCGAPPVPPVPTLPPTVRPLPVRPPASVTATGSDTGAETVRLDSRYTPFAAGRSWTYRVRTTAAGQTETGTVTWRVDEAAGDTTAVTVTATGAGQTHTLTNRLVRHADGTVTITTVSDGQSQSQTVKPEAGQTPAAPPSAPSGLAGTRESVTVPAGTFAAIRVASPVGDGKGQLVAWYAPDVGLIRQEVTATTDQGAVSSTMDLETYR